MPSKTVPIYQLKISLDHIRPPIWRRILVSGNVYLGRLHDILQVVMGWTDSHLHQFTIQGKIYGDPENDEYGDLGIIDEWDVRLKQALTKAGQRFQYEYDFGDSWDHTLVVENILPPDPKMRWPVCLEGQRNRPPEDVGGIGGYSNFLQAIRNRRHEEHDSYLKWVGGAFDPEAFDLQAVNRRLQKLKKSGTLDVEDWPAEPEYPKRAHPPPDLTWLGEFSRQFQPTVETLPLRRDMLTFLQYLQTNRVAGTQSTGNLPLKAAEAICASFVNPIPFSTTIGTFINKVRSSSEVWPLLLLHILASTGGLVEGGPGRHWQVTNLGVKYMKNPGGVQVWLLFCTWWTQVNWGIAAAYAPQYFPTEHLRPVARQVLLNLPLEHPFPFEQFADQLIAASHLSWPAGDAEYQRSKLHYLIGSIVAAPLRDFGVLELTIAPHPQWGALIQEITAVTLTALGREMLSRLEGTSGGELS